MNTARMIAVSVVSATGLFAGFGAIGAATQNDQPVVEKKIVKEDRPERSASDDPNRPEADWREYESPYKDDAPKSDHPTEDSTPVQHNDTPKSERAEKVHAPASDPASAKPECDQKAEDGSCVGPDFYDRTDYNRNGITDQEEPGWDNGAGEDAFKEEGTASFREWCQQQASDHECRN
jgi:hypothetical protein